ncbi:MAG: M14 family metallopeptidase [Acidobacteriota bacterium]|nr:M14 family metallopeptidase [Acidobacteriota bacterium]
MVSPIRLSVLVLLCLVAPLALGAPPAHLELEALFPGQDFAPDLPTPAAFTGVEIGARPWHHDQVLAYLRRLAELSPRARMLEYGRTHEGRAMVVFAVGAPEVVEDLEAFRRRHAALTEPAGPVDPAALEQARAVAWMAYGIHGDELSSTDAAVALAYLLVAGEGGLAARLRSEVLVLIDPCENPDGRERFLAQVAAFAHRRPSEDPNDLSHTNVWPWGRGNHYLFDLNRDWFTMVHPESRRSAEIARWNPQLMVDSHEMGPESSYLFSPPRHPFNPHRPFYLRAWAQRFSADQARALDARGFGYYTGEWNEEFFPGYGSSWAAYRGAIGILYEMSQTDGTAVRKRSGARRNFAQAVLHQLTSSVANLETLAVHRKQVLADFIEKRREWIVRARKAGPRAWVVDRGLFPERVDHLAELLDAQGIRFSRLAEPAVVGGLVDGMEGGETRASLAAGSLLVPTDQAAGPLVRVLFDPHVAMSAAFLREEREYLERGKGSRLYETTAWSLPLAYGLRAYWSAALPSGPWSTFDPPEPRGRLEGPRRGFGFLVDGSADRSAALAAELMREGLTLRRARDPFRVAGRGYPAGSLLVVREENPENLVEILEAAAERHRLTIVGTATADSQEGPDLGGGRFDLLRRPRIAVLTGMPIAPASYGAVWHLLDEALDQPFTALDVGRLGRVDLSRYNVIVLPPLMTGAKAFRSLLGKAGLGAIRQWVEAGGTLIGLGASAVFVAEEDSGLGTVRPRREVLDRHPPPVAGLEPERLRHAGWRRALGLTGEEADGADDEAADPYAIAPLLGPAARPFGGDPGGLRPGLDKPLPLARWLARAWPGRFDKKPPRELVEQADARLRRFHPRGAMLRGEVDPESWLAAGLATEMPVWVSASAALVAEPPVQVVVRLARPERLHLGGLLWPEAAARWAHTAYLTRQAQGRGQIILFLSEPDFRGLTLATRRLLVAAMIYGPGQGTRWSPTEAVVLR